MVSKARIRLWSVNVENLNYVVNQIKAIAEKTGVRVWGPIPLPTKRLVVPVLKLPHGEGSKKWEKWEMRIHKRIIYIAADERAMRQLIRIRVPPEIWMEAELTR